MSLPGNIPHFSEASMPAGPLSLVEGSEQTVDIEPIGPTFDDFGGLDREIAQLRQVGALLQDPELVRRYGLKLPTGILLCGPGGVGKSQLIEAFSADIGATLLNVDVSDIQDKWVGESNKNLRQAFVTAENTPGNVVIFFDEFDGLFSANAGGNAGVSTALISEMKTRMERLRKQQPNTIVAAATNSLSGFDEALLRPGRFDMVLQIPKPGESARASIFGKMILKNADLYAVDSALSELISRDIIDISSLDTDSDEAYEIEASSREDSIDVVALAAVTEGLTGADIEAILHAARMRKVVDFIQHGMPLSRIIQSDIVHAINNHRQQRLHTGE